MKNKIRFIAAFIISTIAFFIYSFNIRQAVFYHPDFARDLHEILKITQGHLVFLGPKLTFGGLYTGPYYFYIFAPIFFITNANIDSIYFFHSFLFALSVGYFFWRVSTRFSQNISLAAALSLLLLPLFLSGPRNPSNAYTFLPLLVIFLTEIYMTQKWSWQKLLIVGFLGGVVANFHFINFVYLIPVSVYLLINLKEKKKYFYYYIGGFTAAFLPLIAFEIKNKFIIITNTFIQKSYLSWMNNGNIPGGMAGKKNIIENIFFMSQQMQSFVLFNPLFLFAVIFLAILIKKKKISWGLFITAFAGLLFFASIIRFQFIPHYLIGVSFFLFFTALFIALKEKLSYLISLFVILEVLFFPKALFSLNYQRKPAGFEKAVDYAINKKLISKTDNFNVIQITKENLLAPIGFEYRFFLRKKGYIAKTEFEYGKSQKLLIFSERPEYDINTFPGWEAEQFGKQYFISSKRYKSGNTIIYIVTKN